MFPGLFKGRFLILLLLLYGIMLVFLCFAGSVHFWETLVKTGLRDGEIKSLVEKLKLIASYLSCDREQAKSESSKNTKAREQHRF